MKNFAEKLYHFSKKIDGGPEGCRSPGCVKEKTLFYCSRKIISYCSVKGLNPDRNAMQLMLCTKDTLGQQKPKNAEGARKGQTPPSEGPNVVTQLDRWESSQKEGEWSPLTPETTRTTLVL